jgi:hypothetical protein
MNDDVEKFGYQKFIKPKNEALCVLPWTHVYVSPSGDMGACCASKTLYNYQKGITLEKFFNSQEIKQLRLDMIDGKKNSICSVCYDQESNDIDSQRIGANNIRKHIVHKIQDMTESDGTVKEFKLTHLDFRFNNLCNFKCRSCNGTFSTSIASEEKSNPKLIEFSPSLARGFLSNQTLMQEFEKQYDNLETIYFAGGEPMMQQEHWDILERMVSSDRAKDVALFYATNGSKLTYKDKSAFLYWKKFQSVWVQISIDGMGKQAEYWRDGTDWEEVHTNIMLMKNHASYSNNLLKYSLHSTIAWPNIYTYIDLVKMIMDTKLVSLNNLSIWCLQEPSEYSLKNIPDFKKEEITTAIDNFLINVTNTNVINNFKSIKNFMMMPMENNSHNNRFEKHFMLDKIRKKDFFEYFPEHENMREFMKNE